MKCRVVSTCLLVTLCSLFSPVLARADVVLFGGGSNQFSMEFVTIGNPGNDADTTGDPNPAGAVPYTFWMGKYEVSEGMITKANASVASGGGALGITTTSRGADKPAASISWNEAARFVNWLNTSSGFLPAYKFTTQPGDVGYSANENASLWVSGDTGYDAANPFRNSEAQFFLPSVHEWHKAAFHDASAGTAGTYFDYPTGSDTAPTAVASGTTTGTAVYLQSGPADITLAGGLSPYGTMGQGGNVREWEETEYDLVNDDGTDGRGLRGGDFIDAASFLTSSYRSDGDPPTYEGNRIGFRVASVPEPSSLLCCGVVAIGVWGWRRLTG